MAVDPSETLTGLSVAELGALADGIMLVPARQARLDELIARSADGPLGGADGRELDRLLDLADRLAVLKTRARYTLGRPAATWPPAPTGRTACSGSRPRRCPPPRTAPRPARPDRSPEPFWQTVAKRCGWLGRTHDGRPGWSALWHGWRDVALLVEGTGMLGPPSIA